jgi:hypothetical protein
MCRRSGGPWRPGRRKRIRDLVRISLELLDLPIMLGAFVVASALAGALGAVNLGTALAFGQIGFALAVVALMLRRS